MATGTLDIAAIQAIYGIPANCHDSAYKFMDSVTKRAAKPREVSDTHRTPRTKFCYRNHLDSLLPTTDCECSISHDCSAKPNEEIDCRSLAPDPKPAHATSDLRSGRLIKTNIQKELEELVRTVKYFGTLEQDLRNSTGDHSSTLQYIRKWISDMRCISITESIVAQSNILTTIRTFFGWIITNRIRHHRVPQDVRYDLEWLKRKWQKGDLNLADPLRGIQVDHYHLGRSLDKDWRFYNPNWKEFGNNGLISGETWPNQVAILRDGGHGAMEAGIAGITGKGTTSIILSDPENRLDYADVDRGTTVDYVSTASRNKKPTRCTQHLLESYEYYKLREKTAIEEEDLKNKDKTEFENRPVRLFRSWRLSDKNVWRPRSGFRYDGLYDIVESRLLDPSKAIYRFAMQRQDGQGDIRVDQPDDQMCLLYYQVRGVQRAAKRKRVD